MKLLQFLSIAILLTSCSEQRFDNKNLGSNKVLFLWTEQELDENGRYTNMAIYLNQGYIDTICDEEKAALGYVATFVGNECYWDGQIYEDGSNSKCKILSALDLGYQCSNQHLDFLRFWFRTDSLALIKLNDCSPSPYTATLQDSFDEIQIVRLGAKIIVNYRASGLFLRENCTWSWEEIVIFKITDDGLRIVNSYRRNISNSTYNSHCVFFQQNNNILL